MRNMKKYKKPLLIVLLILLVPLLVIRNLYKHSAYYAQYTPHKEGIEPVPMMLIDHNHDIHYILDDIGADCYEHGYYIRDDYKGHKTVILKKSGYDDEGYQFVNHEDISYHFDRDLNVIVVFQDGRFYFPTDEEVAEAKKEMTDAFLPVVKRQWPPLINFQWLFDRVYHDRFN